MFWIFHTHLLRCRHIIAPAPVSAPSSSMSDLINLLVVGMLQQQQAVLAPKPIVAADPVALPTAPALSISSALALAPMALMSGSLIIPNVSLDDFCASFDLETTSMILKRMNGGYSVDSWHCLGVTSKVKIKNSYATFNLAFGRIRAWFDG